MAGSGAGARRPLQENEVDQQPQIQYATAPDGARIAFFCAGSGTHLVHMPPFPLGHILVEWENRANRAYFQALAAGHRLVRYDGRGAGLSSRDVTDYSLDAKVADIAAVTDHLGLETFALLGFGHSGSAAIAYATRYPDRVSHLVLWHSYARTTDVTSIARIEAARSLIQKDWDSYAQLEGYRVSGWAGGRAAAWYSDYVKQSVTPEALVAAYQSIAAVDVTALLPLVRAPTLVIARMASEVLPVEVARNLTAAIPNARLVLLEGTGVIPFPDVVDQFVDAITRFLAEPPEPPPGRAGMPVAPLTPRETEILRLVARGRTSREIAQELSLSVRTVGRHITNIYNKIGARTRADAASYAIRHRIA
jgi:pimeloyl-ACP methyl ester carboxylesterase/DNA-binding CsgD family transcriptional regulator